MTGTIPVNCHLPLFTNMTLQQQILDRGHLSFDELRRVSFLCKDTRRKFLAYKPFRLRLIRKISDNIIESGFKQIKYPASLLAIFRSRLCSSDPNSLLVIEGWLSRLVIEKKDDLERKFNHLIHAFVMREDSTLLSKWNWSRRPDVDHYLQTVESRHYDHDKPIIDQALKAEAVMRNLTHRMKDPKFSEDNREYHPWIWLKTLPSDAITRETVQLAKNYAHRTSDLTERDRLYQELALACARSVDQSLRSQIAASLFQMQYRISACRTFAYIVSVLVGQGEIERAKVFFQTIRNPYFDWTIDASGEEAARREYAAKACQSIAAGIAKKEGWEAALRYADEETVSQEKNAILVQLSTIKAAEDPEEAAKLARTLPAPYRDQALSRIAVAESKKQSSDAFINAVALAKECTHLETTLRTLAAISTHLTEKNIPFSDSLEDILSNFHSCCTKSN